MSNKKKGTDWEFRFCELLANRGFWAHRIEPDVRGAQPFDVIAARSGLAYAFDCKTCDDNWFRISRVEENQKMSFELWQECGNRNALFAILHGDEIHIVSYNQLIFDGRVKLDENTCWAKDPGKESE